jgi:hypothetical protein
MKISDGLAPQALPQPGEDNPFPKPPQLHTIISLENLLLTLEFEQISLPQTLLLIKGIFGKENYILEAVEVVAPESYVAAPNFLRYEMIRLELYLTNLIPTYGSLIGFQLDF